jgi:TPR repeat protein
VPKNDKLAFGAIAKAADHGGAEEQYALATYYMQGIGIAADPAEAAKHLAQSAAQGFPKAQYMLGLRYAEGAGVPRDPARAVELLSKAANQGYPKAQIALNRLRKAMAAQAQGATTHNGKGGAVPK